MDMSWGNIISGWTYERAREAAWHGRMNYNLTLLKKKKWLPYCVEGNMMPIIARLHETLVAWFHCPSEYIHGKINT